MIWLVILLVIISFLPPFRFLIQDILGGIFNLIAFLFHIGIGYIILAIIVLMAYRS